MAIEIINVGASPNDGNGDPIRDAFIKCNDNFDELDTTKIGGSGTDNFVAKFNGTDTIENSLIFDDGSFVGVNTTSPTTTLEVSGIDYSFSAGRQASNRKVSIGLNDNGQPSIQSFSSSNAPVNLTINPSGGNIGIGTLNPSEKLDVNGMAKFGSILTNASNGSGGQEAIRINNDNGYIGFFNSANSVRSGYLQGNTTDVTLTTSNSTPLIFGTANTERMRILSNGNVGIGNTNPLYKFHVRTNTNGNIGFRNPTDFNAGWTTGSAIGVFNDADNANEKLYIETSQLGLNLTSQANTLIGGNVGIGTTTPSTKLEVVGNFKSSLSGYEFQVYPAFDTNVVGMGASSNHSLAIVTNATERMRITTGGNVGIGTTSPSAKLDVINNSTYQLRLASSSSNYSSGGLYLGSLGTSDPFYYGFARWNQDNFCFEIGSQHGNNSGGITFLTGTGTASQLERMRILANGNVGIGTANPLSIFQVGLQGSTADTSLTIGSSTTSTGNLFFADGTGINQFRGYLQYQHNFDALVIGTASEERMRITASGNVGIGTTSPTSKLHVAGNTYSEGLHIATGQFSQSGGITAGFYAFSNVSVNKSFMITLRQSGNGANNVVGMAFTFGAGGTAYNLGQDNTNPVLNLSLTMVGLVLTLTTGAGYGTTTWEYTITQIK